MLKNRHCTSHCHVADAKRKVSGNYITFYMITGGGVELDRPKSVVTNLVTRKLTKYSPFFKDFFTNFLLLSPVIVPLPMDRYHTPDRKTEHFPLISEGFAPNFLRPNLSQSKCLTHFPPGTFFPFNYI